VVLLAALVALGGCGDGDSEAGGSGDDTTTRQERDATAPQETTSTPEQAAIEESPASRRDRELQRELERHLRQEAAGVSSGWTFADVEDVQVRATRVAIATRLRPARRDAAASLCLAARRFFLQGGQGQTPYDLLVTEPGGTALGRC
jgi:hypothetical protein